MRRTWSTIVCLLIVSLSGVAAAWETWYVDASVSTPGDGTSWGKAFNRIQDGIDAAKDGDIVMVAQGEYHENIRFQGKNISLTGMDRAKTVISGQSAGTVVTFLGTEGQSCSLSEFTIKDGLAYDGGGILGNGCRARIQNNDITSNVAEECGGGLCGCHGLIQGNTIMSNQAKLNGGGLHDCDGMIYNNTIEWNIAQGYRDQYVVMPPNGRGGGLYGCDGTIQVNTIRANEALYGGGLSECGATIQYNTIVSNRAVEVVIPNSVAVGGGGGGLFLCGAIIRYNTIQANNAGYDGGGLSNCDGIIQENAISGNVADWVGGGLGSCDGLIQGNIIKENFADLGGGLVGCKGKIQNNSIVANWSNTGGGLGFCDASIRGNLILGNRASNGEGGGLYRCHEHISCNTIVGNWADEGGGIYWCSGTVRNNIVWGNDANSGRQILYQTNPTYCCIEGWTAGGDGNIASAPGFVDSDGTDNDPSTFEDNNYRLMSRSPCIDQGYNEPWMSGAKDLDGNNRVFNGWLSSTVDMGAYEFGSRVFQILEVKRAGGGTRLTWDSDLGESFAVWSCTSLPGAMQVIFWTKEATVFSQGSSTQWTDNSTRESTKFYWVELQ